MLNFALGPVMSSDLVLEIGSQQTPYFRTPEFSQVTLENEKLMKEMLYSDEDSRVIFLTGSGTAGMDLSHERLRFYGAVSRPVFLIGISRL